jgi:hypothetical protein
MDPGEDVEGGGGRGGGNQLASKVQTTLLPGRGVGNSSQPSPGCLTEGSGAESSVCADPAPHPAAQHSAGCSPYGSSDEGHPVCPAEVGLAGGGARPPNDESPNPRLGLGPGPREPRPIGFEDARPREPRVKLRLPTAGRPLRFGVLPLDRGCRSPSASSAVRHHARRASSTAAGLWVTVGGHGGRRLGAGNGQAKSKGGRLLPSFLRTSARVGSDSHQGPVAILRPFPQRWLLHARRRCSWVPFAARSTDARVVCSNRWQIDGRDGPAAHGRSLPGRDVTLHPQLPPTMPHLALAGKRSKSALTTGKVRSPAEKPPANR